MANNTYYESAGSDFSMSFNWPDGNGGNLDLTGYTVALIEHEANYTWTSLITDAATGEITVTLKWQDDIPTGRKTSFRVQITDGSNNSDAPNKMWICYE